MKKTILLSAVITCVTCITAISTKVSATPTVPNHNINNVAPSGTTPTPAPGRTTPAPVPGRTTPTPAPTPVPGRTTPTPAPVPGRTTPAPAPGRTTPAPAPGRTTPTPVPGNNNLPGDTPAPGTNQYNNTMLRTTPTPAPGRTTPAPVPGRTTPTPAPGRTAPAPDTTPNNTEVNQNRGTLRTIMVNPAVRLSMSGATGSIKISDSNSYKQIDVAVDIDNTKITNAQLVIDIPKNLILGSYSNGEDIASIQNTTNIIQPDGSRTLTFNFLPNTNGTQKLDFLVMLPNGAFGAAQDYTITARLDQAGSMTQQMVDTLKLIPMEGNQELK